MDVQNRRLWYVSFAVVMIRVGRRRCETVVGGRKFRLEILGPEELHVYAGAEDVVGITTYLLAAGIVAVRNTECVTVKARWRDVFRALANYPFEPSQA